MKKNIGAASLAVEVKSGPRMETCEYCDAELIYPGKLAFPDPRDNRIVGRSKAQGYVCRNCVRVETDWRDDATAEFYEKHKDDEWGSFIRASADLPGKWRADAEGRKDVSEFIAVMKKKCSAGLGKPLPYNPDVREHHVSRESSVRMAEREAETA